MKAKLPLFRTLWAMFVVAGSTIALYVVTRLFIQYFANGVNMMITEERDKSLTFPAITLCNLNPLANNNISHDLMMTYMEAARTIGARDDYFNRGHLFDPAILFANSGTFLNNTTADQFLVSCQWNMRPGGATTCNAKDSQMFMYQASLGYCFTLTPPDTLGFVSGFAAILYLDDDTDLIVPFYKLTISPPLSVGAYVSVHQRNTLPDLSEGAVLLAGSNSHVNIRVKQRFRQPEPYSNCTCQSMLPKAPQYDYTQKSCQNLCAQNAFIKNCGCIGAQAIFVPSLEGYNGEPLCGILFHDYTSQSLQVFLREQHCIREVLSDPAYCDQQCPVACEEHRYQLTTESTPWPHPALRLAFWRDYITTKTYSHKFESLREMIPNRRDNRTERVRKSKLIWNDDLLTRNFLQVFVSEPQNG